jgi:hypothetical protein
VFLGSGGVRRIEDELYSSSSSVAWHHSVAGYVSPTKSPRISAIIAGANRMLAAPAARKVPLTIGLLVQLVEFCVSSPSASSTDTPLLLQRFRFFALVSFFAFLRFSDFSVLRVRHSSFFLIT